MTPIASIGFIGVGVMGAPIARRLAAAGYSLTVCDVNSTALAAFRAAGVHTAAHPAGCAGCDVVMVLVLTDEQVREVVHGPQGLLRHIDERSPPIVVILSTVQPDTIRSLARALADRGAVVLDAPVSGGRDGAQAGTLSVMVGGDSDVYAHAKPVLDVVGNRVAHCGPLGSGVTTKILNNILGVANWLLMAETMAIGARLGMDLDALASVMEHGSGRNLATRNWPSRRDSYASYAQDSTLVAANLSICRKDLALALELAERAGITPKAVRGFARALDAVSAGELQRAWAAIGGG